MQIEKLIVLEDRGDSYVSMAKDQELTVGDGKGLAPPSRAHEL